MHCLVCIVIVGLRYLRYPGTWADDGESWNSGVSIVCIVLYVLSLWGLGTLGTQVPRLTTGNREIQGQVLYAPYRRYLGTWAGAGDLRILGAILYSASKNPFTASVVWGILTTVKPYLLV